MEVEWTPLSLLVAKYLAAWLASLFALCLSSDTLTLRKILGWTGFYGLLGGSFAPLGAALPIWPAEVTRAERLIASAFALGGALVPLPWIKEYIQSKLGTPNASASRREPDAGS